MKTQLKSLMYGAILALPCGLSAQTFTENFGSVGSTSTIAQASPGFVNPGFTYSGTADVRNTAPSVVTNYAAASGAANVFITNTAGKYFQIEGVNSSIITTPVLTFGISKSTTAATGANFLVEVSSDGVTYTALTIPAFPVGSGTAKWYYVTASGSIPSAANLRIRFKNNDVTTQYRIDDVKLSSGTGTTTPCTASITAGGATSFCNGGSVLLTASTGTAYVWSSGATTQTVSATQSGVYSVTVTAASGCTAVANTAVMVYPTPTIVASASSSNACAGSNVTLTAGPLATDLFFSEYVEGSGNEKYIEIYNGTGHAVNLSDYVYKAFHNGASLPTFTLQLGNVLANNSVLVLHNPAAGLYGPDSLTSAVAHNGNDALALYKTSTASYVDIFGVIGVDPISSWTAPVGFSTVDHTLRRKPSVYSGVTVNPTGTGQTGFTTLGTEWIQYAIDDVSGLGSHSMDATSYAWSAGTTPSTGNAVVVTPASNGVYTVSATFSTTGCSATATVQVNVVPGPTLVIDNDTPTIFLCYGPQSANLTGFASGAEPFTYAWSTTETTSVIAVSPTVTTSYSLTVTDNSGCSVTEVTEVELVNACCEGTNVIICVGTETDCVTPEEADMRIGTGTVTAGPCVDGARRMAPKNTQSAIRNSVSVSNVYPNPFVDNAVFAVKLSEGSNVKIEIMDYTGKKVVELNNSVLAAGSYEFNWNGNNAAGSNVVSGLYLCRIVTGNTVQTIKLQKSSK